MDPNKKQENKRNKKVTFDAKSEHSSNEQDSEQRQSSQSIDQVSSEVEPEDETEAERRRRRWWSLPEAGLLRSASISAAPSDEPQPVTSGPSSEAQDEDEKITSILMSPALTPVDHQQSVPTSGTGAPKPANEPADAAPGLSRVPARGTPYHQVSDAPPLNTPPADTAAVSAIPEKMHSGHLTRGFNKLTAVSSRTSLKSEGPSQPSSWPHPPPVSGAVHFVPLRGRKGRPYWRDSKQFLVAMTSLAFGWPNFIMFPTLAIKHGSGDFIVAYLIVAAALGWPMVFLELAIGQFCGFGPPKVWGVVPAFKGLGYAQLVMAFIVLVYFTFFNAICIHYLGDSFHNDIPWSSCKGYWVQSEDNCFFGEHNTTTDAIFAPELYFRRRMLNMTSDTTGLDEGTGPFVPYLVLCCCCASLLSYLAFYSGMATYRRIILLLALAPYGMLLFVMPRALSWDGAWAGIQLLLSPTWKPLLYEPMLWIKAIAMCMNSFFITLGPNTVFASFNPFRQNVYRASYRMLMLDVLNCLLCAVIVYSFAGHLAKLRGVVPTADVLSKPAMEGGLIMDVNHWSWLAYSTIAAEMPYVPQMFSILIYGFILAMGIANTSAFLAVLSVACVDINQRVRRSFFRPFTMALACLTALIYATRGGQQISHLVNWTFQEYILICLALTEVLVICWIYGVNKLCTDVEFMVGIYPNNFLKFMWLIGTPGLFTILFLITVPYIPWPTYSGYKYPEKVIYALIAIFLIVLVGPMILGFLHTMYNVKGETDWRKRFYRSFEYSKFWGPQEMRTRALWEAHKSQFKYRLDSFWPSP